MNYEMLFDEITRTIRKDYAGAAEITNPREVSDFSYNLSQAFKMKKLDDIYFLRVMNQYLATIRDKNLTLTLRDNDHYQSGDRGIEVRCHEKELYVTASRDERIKPGDKLGKINAKSPKWYLEHMTKNVFWSDEEERMDWKEFLISSERVRVDRPDGTREFMDLKTFPEEKPQEEIVFSQPAEDTVCLRIDSFLDTEKVAQALAEHEEAIGAAGRLILDLRRNRGGFDNAFYPLLPYVTDHSMLLRDFMGEQGLYTNYTKKNSKRRVSQLTPYLTSEEEGYKELAEELIEEAKEKSGAGYVYEKDEDLAADDQMLEKKGPEKVIILTDTFTEDAAELFVQQASRMKRVTVVGRPTGGTIDYSNNVAVAFEGGFVFSYPISRSSDCQKGKCVKNVGLPVDVYVPWTPEELEKDVILQKALEV